MSFKHWFSLVLVTLVACILPVSITAAAEECGSIPIQYGGALPSPSLSRDSSFKLVSLNIARETDVDQIIQDVGERRALSDADVWFLQEAVHRPGASHRTTGELARMMGLHFAYAAADVDNEGTTSGLAILSRYPLSEVQQMALPRYDLRFRSRCRIALAATIYRKSGPLRLFNVHLDTRINAVDRLGQIDLVLQSAASASGPVIVGGDFNTNNLHWFWNVLPFPFLQDQVGVIRKAFLRDGFDSPLDKLGATFKLLWLPLSLDWIFPKGMRTLQSGVERIDFSDHNAVWVSLTH